MTSVTLVQVSDLHFGRDVDLAQVHALEELVPALEPSAIVLAGDLTQRARHGEFQAALGMTERFRAIAPTLVVPGNHDVSWWVSPLGARGKTPIYRKYRRYFGDELGPRLEVPGAVLVGLVSAHGVAPGSLTWNLRDIAVKGHLPASETERLAATFRAAPAEALRVAVLHHNVLRGEISRRMGLAHWRDAQQRLVEAGTDLILCAHDHQEGAALLDGTVVVSTSSTHTSRTRGHRPSAFNVVTADESNIRVQHQRWDRAAGAFRVAGEPFTAPRRRVPARAGAIAGV